MDFKTLAFLKKLDASKSDARSFSTTEYDINSLARKIHATKAAKINALNLKKSKKATA